MKKIIAIVVLCFVAIKVPIYVCAAPGDISGEVLNTDIRAYINDLPISSYNIDGYTGITAEDLRNYGFDVMWYDDLRELQIRYNPDMPVTPSYIHAENTNPVGSHAGYVYETDIRTFLSGEGECQSYNIGGSTIIIIDDLGKLGNSDVIWDEEKREIRFIYKASWEMFFETNPYDEMGEGINGFTFNAQKNENGTFDVSGDNYQHLAQVKIGESNSTGLNFSFSLVAKHLLGDEDFSKLCWDMSTIRYDGVRMQDNADIANEHVKIAINGIEMKITEVKQGKGNNHEDFYLVLNGSFEKDNIQSISVVCN